MPRHRERESGLRLYEAYEPLLGRARGKDARARIEAAARETPRAGARRTVQAVEQPVIDARGAMEPDRVVDARHDEVAPQERGAMRRRGRVEQPIVRDVREQTAMQRFVVG